MAFSEHPRPVVYSEYSRIPTPLSTITLVYRLELPHKIAEILPCPDAGRHHPMAGRHLQDRASELAGVAVLHWCRGICAARGVPHKVLHQVRGLEI